jgi:hypothetical protein
MILFIRNRAATIRSPKNFLVPSPPMLSRASTGSITAFICFPSRSKATQVDGIRVNSMGVLEWEEDFFMHRIDLVVVSMTEF